MRATIVADDNVVYVDGNWAIVDCSALAAEGKHAVQWYDTIGDVEFKSVIENNKVTRQPNETITDLSPYQIYIDQWEVEYAKRMAVEALQKKGVEFIEAEVKKVEARLKNEKA